MSKLDKITIGEIIESTNLYLTTANVGRIWKDGTPDSIIKRGQHLLEQLLNIDELRLFIANYGIHIDKTKFIICLIDSYNQRLREGIKKSEREEMEKGLEKAKELISDIDETFIFFDEDEQNYRIKKVLVFNTQEVSQGRSRKERNDNTQRLAELEKDIDFSTIAQAILRFDIEYVISIHPKIGEALRYKIEYNSVSRDLDSISLRKQLKNINLHNLVQDQDHSMFEAEIEQTLRDNIEELDFDKLLLSAARNYMEVAELTTLEEGQTEELKANLELIKKHIRRPKAKVPRTDNTTYSIRELEQDLKRFLVIGSNTVYISKSACEKLKQSILDGEQSINDLTVSMVELLNLKPADFSKILRQNPNNYIFFLRQSNCPYRKEIILKDIIGAGQCSSDLLELLCEKTDITSEEVLELFERELISVTDLKKASAHIGRIITDEKLLEKYQEYKEKRNDEEEAETAKIQLERYALAYRNTELIGRSPEEIEERGEEFIANVVDEIEPTDLVPLYGHGIISLKVAASWGGDDIVEQLLKKETLKLADVRFLRDNGLLNKDVLERLFKNNPTMSYSYQVALVSTVFNGQTEEEKKITDSLAQYYNIENVVETSSSKRTTTKRNAEKCEGNNQHKHRVNMRDPGTKFNLLESFDSDTKIEEGIIDGHIILHYPNIDDGTVLIEKLHKKTAFEIRADNESATYVLPEEEFIKLKKQLIKGGKVDRTQLTQRWWIIRDTQHWIPHDGQWERKLKERLGINKENPRLTQQDLDRIDKLIEESIASRNGEDR